MLLQVLMAESAYHINGYYWYSTIKKLPGQVHRACTLVSGQSMSWVIARCISELFVFSSSSLQLSDVNNGKCLLLFLPMQESTRLQRLERYNACFFWILIAKHEAKQRRSLTIFLLVSLLCLCNGDIAIKLGSWWSFEIWRRHCCGSALWNSKCWCLRLFCFTIINDSFHTFKLITIPRFHFYLLTSSCQHLNAFTNLIATSSTDWCLLLVTRTILSDPFKLAYDQLTHSISQMKRLVTSQHCEIPPSTTAVQSKHHINPTHEHTSPAPSHQLIAMTAITFRLEITSNLNLSVWVNSDSGSSTLYNVPVDIFHCKPLPCWLSCCFSIVDVNADLRYKRISLAFKYVVSSIFYTD